METLSIHPGDKASVFLPAQEGKGGGPGSTWHLHTGLSHAGPQHVLKMRLVLSQGDRDKDPVPENDVLAAFHGGVQVLLPWSFPAKECLWPGS